MSARAVRVVLLVASLAGLSSSTACRSHVEPRDGRGGSGFPGAGLSAMSGFDLALNAFHLAKDQPSHAMEAHHYCKQVFDELAQCVLFDRSTADAHLVGVEYIISERMFESLPAPERALWHPHNYEILSGQLVVPGLSDPDEKKLLAGKMNSYGKTWHLWSTGMFGMPGDVLPVGLPSLQWSYNADGEAPRAMVEERDRRLGISTAQKRMSRVDLVGQARPQEGVDALAPAFPYRQSIPGVVDEGFPSRR